MKYTTTHKIKKGDFLVSFFGLDFCCSLFFIVILGTFFKSAKNWKRFPPNNNQPTIHNPPWFPATCNSSFPCASSCSRSTCERSCAPSVARDWSRKFARISPPSKTNTMRGCKRCRRVLTPTSRNSLGTLRHTLLRSRCRQSAIHIPYTIHKQ